MEPSDAWNVGRVDEAVRLLLVLAVLGTAGWVLRSLNADWGLPVVIAATLATGYLVLTSLAHDDPLYAVFGIDTRHRRAR